MKSAEAEIFRTSFSYGNIVKEQVAKYLYYPTFNMPYLFSDSFKVQTEVQSPPHPLRDAITFFRKWFLQVFKGFAMSLPGPPLESRYFPKT